MKEIDFNELRDLQLEILNKVDTFCRENNINYFLTAGTLIGAVRHKGYIPWDDDIDIMMLRDDYEKFLKTFNGKVDNLVVAAPELDWNYYAPYANIYDDRTLLDEGDNGHHGLDLGVKIDVFPFDEIPNNRFHYYINRRLVFLLNRTLRLKRDLGDRSRFSLRDKLAASVFYAFSYANVQKIIHRIATCKRGKNTDDVFLACFDIVKPMRAPKKWFSETIYLPFEQYKFPVPIEYDSYLKVRYGDYMKLPPKDQQIPHHGFKVYWK